MTPNRKTSTWTAAALLGLGLWATSAVAGHANIVLKTELRGSEEVPAAGQKNKDAGDPNGRGEAYVFGIDGDPTTLCYLLVDVKRIEGLKEAPGNGRAAHIHEGARGSNGPVVANLAWPQDGQAADCLTEGEEGKGMAAGIVQRILSNPTAFYINVHNPAYPSGAIRGQLGDVAGHKH